MRSFRSCFYDYYEYYTSHDCKIVKQWSLKSSLTQDMFYYYDMFSYYLADMQELLAESQIKLGSKFKIKLKQKKKNLNL